MPEWIERLRLGKRRRELQKNSDRLFQALESDMVKTEAPEKRRDLESVRQFLCAQFDDEILAIESRELVSRARRCHINVSDLGLPPGHEEHWIHSVHGAWFLHPKSFSTLAKMVEEAEYERPKTKPDLKDFWWRLVTAIAAIVAAIASVLNFLQHR